MEAGAEIQEQITTVVEALGQALGDAALCIALYGSAAGDDFAPGHSDVNLLIVLREVGFADLRLIGATLEREATGDLIFATPLVVAPSFLRDARDSFPIEVDDIANRHRVLHGEDLLSGIKVNPQYLREEAEREARSELLRLRALVMHRPVDENIQRALAGVCVTMLVIERTLLGRPRADPEWRGTALLAEVGRRQGISLEALARLHAMREENEAWPTGDALEELTAATLREVEAVVAWIDAHAGAPLGADEGT